MWPIKVFEFGVCFKLWIPYIILNLHGQNAIFFFEDSKIHLYS
jgi:hypothetical protein